MKRYKLEKDLPTFKVGDTFYLTESKNLFHESDGLMVYNWAEIDKFPNIFDWFEEIKEPLIKDEKVRKAVRAWAEANGYGKDEVYEFVDFSTGWKSWSLEHKVNGDDNEIHFNGGIDFDKVENQGYYTIDELCGEEE